MQESEIAKHEETWQEYLEALTRCYQIADLARFHTREAHKQSEIAAGMFLLTAFYIKEYAREIKNERTIING